MTDFNATPFSDKNAAASQAGVINNDPPQSRPKPRTAQPGNDSLPRRKDGSVSLDPILGPSRFDRK
jgi:hypothetical protein